MCKKPLNGPHWAQTSTPHLIPVRIFLQQRAYLCRWNECPRQRRRLVPASPWRRPCCGSQKKCRFFFFLKQNKNLLWQKRQKRSARTSGQVVHEEGVSHAQRCGSWEFQMLYTDLVCHWELGGWDTWDVWQKCPGPGDLCLVQVFRANTGSCVPFSIKAGVRAVGLVDNCIVVSPMVFSHFFIVFYILCFFIFGHTRYKHVWMRSAVARAHGEKLWFYLGYLPDCFNKCPFPFSFVNVKPIYLIQCSSQSFTEVSVSWQAGSAHWVNVSLFCKAELDEWNKWGYKCHGFSMGAFR